MNSAPDFLIVYTQVAMALVAFSTIVATLRQAFGGRLTKYQNLIFRFYVELGFMNVMLGLIPIALLNMGYDAALVWRVSNYLILICIAFYLPVYLRRRLKVGVPLKAITIIANVGFGLFGLLALATASEQFWRPSLATTSYFLLWSLGVNMAIFVGFLGTFIELDEK